jgi:hypothetical protein
MKSLFANKEGHKKVKGTLVSNGPWAVCNGQGEVAVAVSHKEAIKIMESFPCSYIRPFNAAR